ncbi:hypothetical protein Dimus_016863 [Dionaea muscipula]
MPLSMKIQPIDASTTPEDSSARPEPVKPVMKSRLRRLFRISGPPVKAAGLVEEPALVPAVQLKKEGSGEFEPNSFCLGKMVQNFIEEGLNEKQPQPVKCGRNRCNCFNGSDGSDAEPDYTISSADVSDLLKSLMVCVSVNEKTVLAETAKIVERSKAAWKRKPDFGRIVTESLIAVGYDASICKSKWEKSSSFPAGEYEYIDVIMEGGERLIVDIDFRSEFEIARATKAYKAILQALPCIFVGKHDRLSRIVTLVSEAAKQSLKKKGLHLPPWRRTEYVRAKWFSPHTRLISGHNPTVAAASIPPPNIQLVNDIDPTLTKTTTTHSVSDPESSTSLSSPVLFTMSESSSGDEAMPEKAKSKAKCGSKVGGLASLMVDR